MTKFNMNSYPVSAIIEKNAISGNDTIAWYFSHICEGARVGDNCSIGEKSYIGKGVLIGDNVRIGNNVNIYEGAIIKNNVFVGNNTAFTNVRKPIAGKKGKKLDTIIEDDVSIGANCTIVGGIKIGRGAIIADGAVVVSNVPDGAWANGNPAKIKIRHND